MIYCIDVLIKVEAENKIEAKAKANFILFTDNDIVDHDLFDVYAEGDTGE